MKTLMTVATTASTNAVTSTPATIFLLMAVHLAALGRRDQRRSPGRAHELETSG
jgi:hypothetical protein